MHYRLGEFAPRQGTESLDVVALRRLIRSRREMSDREFTRRLRALTGRRESGAGMPDLLQELEVASPGEDVWVYEAVETVRSLCGQGRRLELLRCEREPGPDGFLALAFLEPDATDAVRRDDVVCAGFAAVRGPEGDLEVLPRLYRKVCSNGEVALAHHAADVCNVYGGVGRAIEMCTSTELRTRVIATFRAAARRRTTDAAAMLLDSGFGDSLEALEDAREAGDDSAWGWYNAATALAKEEPDFRRQLAAERRAARLLELGGVPERTLEYV